MKKHWTRRILALAMALVMATFATAAFAEAMPSIVFNGDDFGVTEA